MNTSNCTHFLFITADLGRQVEKPIRHFKNTKHESKKIEKFSLKSGQITFKPSKLIYILFRGSFILQTGKKMWCIIQDINHMYGSLSIYC